MDENTNKAGDLRVWWIPQVPMPSFYVPVKTVEEAALVLDVLGRYDQFQLDQNVKGDYCNAGGLTIYENREWVDWYYENDNVSFEENELNEYIKWFEGKK